MSRLCFRTTVKFYKFYFVLFLTILVRYNSSTQQIVEMRVKNIEAEEFLNPHSDQIKRLEH